MPSTYTRTCNGRAVKDMILCRVIVSPGTGGSQAIVTEKFGRDRRGTYHHQREVFAAGAVLVRTLILLAILRGGWFLAPPLSNLYLPGYTLS
jgi:hypothetical protein